MIPTRKELIEYCKEHDIQFDLDKLGDRSKHHLCDYGKLEVAKWSYSLGGVDIHLFNDYAFFISCENNQLEVAKWLYYDIGNVDIHAIDDRAFKWSCYHGNLEIAKWLFSLGNIDIHMDDDWVFRNCCISGFNINVVKWLYSLGNVNVHAKDDEVFKLCCYLSSPKVKKIFMKWLIFKVGFLDDKYLNYSNLTREIVRKKEDEIYNIRKKNLMIGYLYGGYYSKPFSKVSLKCFHNCLLLS